MVIGNRSGLSAIKALFAALIIVLAIMMGAVGYLYSQLGNAYNNLLIT